MQDVIIVLFSCLHVEKKMWVTCMPASSVVVSMMSLLVDLCCFEDIETVALSFDHFCHCIVGNSGLHPTVDARLQRCTHFVPITVVAMEKEMVGCNFHSCCIAICPSALVVVALVGGEPVQGHDALLHQK